MAKVSFPAVGTGTGGGGGASLLTEIATFDDDTPATAVEFVAMDMTDGPLSGNEQVFAVRHGSRLSIVPMDAGLIFDLDTADVGDTATSLTERTIPELPAVATYDLYLGHDDDNNLLLACSVASTAVNITLYSVNIGRDPGVSGIATSVARALAAQAAAEGFRDEAEGFRDEAAASAMMGGVPGGGGVALSDDVALAPGTASAGTGTEASRDDHVHPSDPTKASLAGATFTGAVEIGSSSGGPLTVQGENAGNSTIMKIFTPDSGTQKAFGAGREGEFDWVQFAGEIVTGKPGFALGPGTARDTNLYREDANILKTDDAFEAEGTVSSGAAPTADAHLTRKDYVDDADALLAPLISPTFTGEPEVPTAPAGTNNTRAASTAFVVARIAAAMLGGGADGVLASAALQADGVTLRLTLSNGTEIDVNLMTLISGLISAVATPAAGGLSGGGSSGDLSLAIADGGVTFAMLAAATVASIREGYAALSGATFTDVVSGVTPTDDAHFATKAYVDSAAGGGGGSVTDDIYWGTSADEVPVGAELTEAAVNGAATISGYAGDMHVLVSRLATEADFTRIVRSDDLSQTNQIGAFTKFGATVIPTGETEAFSVWVSNQALSQGSDVQWTAS